MEERVDTRGIDVVRIGEAEAARVLAEDLVVRIEARLERF